MQDLESTAGTIADAFSHGYLVRAQGEALPPEVTGWPSAPFGTTTVVFHPKSARAMASGGEPLGPAVLLIGHPVDLERDTRDNEIIAHAALRDLTTGGVEGFTRYVAYLAGRFSALAFLSGEIVVVPDTCATQMTFWSSRGGSVAIGSHLELVASAVGADVNEAGLQLVRDLKDLRPGYTHFFPGLETAYADVYPVTANCRLRWDTGSREPSHERFYPFEEKVERADVDEVYEEFRQLFDQVCRHLTSFGRTGVSLTAGNDSRATFVGARPYLGPDSFTFTYLNPRASRPDLADDLFHASKESLAAGIPHYAIRWRSATPGSTFDEVFSTTWRAYRPSDGAACAMYEDLPHGFFQLQSMHAEVGTVFYRKRVPGSPDPVRLTELYQNEAVAAEPRYVEKFEEFVAYADFDESKFGGWDYHDLFYWEHRNSRWAPQKPHEGDLGHRVLQPFNSRHLIECMQSLPYPGRRDKILLRRMLEDGPLVSDAVVEEPAPGGRLARLVATLRGRA